MKKDSRTWPRTCAAPSSGWSTGAGLGHVGGDLSVTGHPRHAVRRGARHRPRGPGPATTATASSSARATAPARSTRRSPTAGFFPSRELDTFMQPLSRSTATPTGTRSPASRPTPARSATACRSASACAIAGQAATTRTAAPSSSLGDGELQEGSNWEAAMTAGHSQPRQPDRDRRPQPAAAGRPHRGHRAGSTRCADKWRAFGWRGPRGRRPRPRRAARRALAPVRRPGKPICVIANTIKGKGVSFMEDRVEWHHKVPSRGAGRAALEELSDDRRRPAPASDLFDCREAFAEDARSRSAEPTSAIVAVCNDSVGSSNLVGFRERVPDRLINVGIAEQNLVGVGAGLANGGQHPVRLRRRPLPHRPRAGADQGRRRLQPTPT